MPHPPTNGSPSIGICLPKWQTAGGDGSHGREGGPAGAQRKQAPVRDQGQGGGPQGAGRPEDAAAKSAGEFAGGAPARVRAGGAGQQPQRRPPARRRRHARRRQPGRGGTY
eukprot:7021150-Pyramimonas_sp.AAC.1